MTILNLLVLAPIFLLGQQVILLIHNVIALLLVEVLRSMFLIRLILDFAKLLLLLPMIEWIRLKFVILLLALWFFVQLLHLLVPVRYLIVEYLALMNRHLLYEFFTHIFYGLRCIFLLLLTVCRKSIFNSSSCAIYLLNTAIFQTSFTYAAARVLNIVLNLYLVLNLLIAI